MAAQHGRMFASPWKTVNLKRPFWSTIDRLMIALCPPRCVRCQQPGQLEQGSPLDLCTTCESGLPAGTPHQRLGPGMAAFVPWRFEPPIAELIRDLKFHGQPHHARVLGLLLARAVRTAALEPPDCLVPMPLHDARLAERGYNQAAEIAHYAAHALALPVERRWLRRVRATAEQSHLGAQERAANVAGAFACRASTRSARKERGTVAVRAHVVLIDDVVTTGNTALEAAQALYAAGAARVDVWAIARA